VIDKGM